MTQDGQPERPEEVTKLVTIPQMPDLLEAVGLKRVSQARIRQLAATDDNWPEPAFEHGRIRLFEWPKVEQYFRTREIHQGWRTDRRGPWTSDTTRSTE